MSHKTETESQRRFKMLWYKLSRINISLWFPIVSIWPYQFFSTLQSDRRSDPIIIVFEIPDPNFPIHFVTFRELRRRLTHVIGEK